jgi:3-hydroxyisobutyrate dehydrogenase
MEIGYVLCGDLGAAEAQILARTYPVRVWDRSRHSPATLAADGVTAVTNGATLAGACDVIFLCLPHSSDVRAAMSGTDGLMDGLSRGKIVVDRTPGGPDQTRAMASELSAVGAALIDAPASGVWDPGDASGPGSYSRARWTHATQSARCWRRSARTCTTADRRGIPRCLT